METKNIDLFFVLWPQQQNKRPGKVQTFKRETVENPFILYCSHTIAKSLDSHIKMIPCTN